MSKSTTNASPISAARGDAKGQGPDGMNADGKGFVVVCNHCVHAIPKSTKWRCCQCPAELEHVTLAESITQPNVGGYTK